MPTEAQLRKLFPRISPAMVVEILGAVDHFDAADLRLNVSRMAMFFAQFGHETRDFQDFEEDLSYRAERLRAVWPSRFPTAESAAPYARDPEALANKVYGGRMGNIHTGDGWRYRGRAGGLTGRDAYRTVGKLVGYDYEAHPELVSKPFHVIVSACGIWRWKKLNPTADRNDVAGNTRLLNGGTIGLDDRRQRFGLATVILRG